LFSVVIPVLRAPSDNDRRPQEVSPTAPRIKSRDTTIAILSAVATNTISKIVIGLHQWPGPVRHRNHVYGAWLLTRWRGPPCGSRWPSWPINTSVRLDPEVRTAVERAERRRGINSGPAPAGRCGLARLLK